MSRTLRKNPRRRTFVRAETPDGRVWPVHNLSVTGLFVGASIPEESLTAGQILRVWIPGHPEARALRVRARLPRPHGTAVQFEVADPSARHAIGAHVTYKGEQDRLLALHARLNRTAPVSGTSGPEASLAGSSLARLKPIHEDLAVRVGLRPLLKVTDAVEVVGDGVDAPQVATLQAIDTARSRLLLTLAAPPRDLAPYGAVFLVFRGVGTVYLADTAIEAVEGNQLRVVLPERFFRPERRMLEREPAQSLSLACTLGGRTFRGEVVEIDANGLSVWFAEPHARALERAGTLREVRLEAATATPGAPPVLEELRVAWCGRPGTDGRARVGFQRLHRRREVPQVLVPYATGRPNVLKRTWTLARHAFDSLLGRVGVGISRSRPAVWTIPDAEGRPIVALVNASFDLASPPPPGPVAVVLVPPPFARTKEVSSPVALTIVETFRAAGAHVVVVRYDGICHVGESWNDPSAASPELHMLRWTLGQTVRDLATVHAHVRGWLGERPQPTAIVSFSMSAVAARRYLAEGAEGIDLWVAPMGAPDARDIIKNSSGGVDWVGLRKGGATLGVNLLQGHLLDCDAGCDEMLAAGLAELEDARLDMARVRQPVVWLCGLHDYWVNPLRVEDLLGVPAPGPRELLRVPTGHFVRQSDEALETFRLIAGRIASALLGRPVGAQLPTTYQLQDASTHERQRRTLAPFDAQAYWTGYLGATRKNPLGFDVLALTDEYDALMTETVELLGLSAGERLLDLGCGTGNALAATVRRWGRATTGLHLEGVDLVPAVLEGARAKVREACAETGATPTVGFQVVDLALVGDVTVLPYGVGSFDVVVLSLVLPYLSDPAHLLEQARRVLRPGGKLVASTLRPDTDMGGPLQRLLAKIERGDTMVKEGWQADQLLTAVQDYIHSAASLLDLEADGRFNFQDAYAFEAGLAAAGFEVVRTVQSFGDPPMGFVTLARRPLG